MLYTLAGLVKYLSHFSYVGIAAFFGSFGYVMPVPEEAVLTVLGYLAGIGKFNFFLVFIASVAGVLIGDSIFYWLAYRGGKYFDRLKNKIGKGELLKYEKLAADNIGKTLLASRFFIGFRFVGPLIAGSAKIRWRTFLFYDSLIILVYSGFFMFLGFYFRHRLPHIIMAVERSRSLLLAATALILVILSLKLLRKKTPPRP